MDATFTSAVNEDRYIVDSENNRPSISSVPEKEHWQIV